MKPKHQRLCWILVSLCSFCAATLFILQAFRENLVYFYSPSDVMATPPSALQLIRIGGLVKMGSLKPEQDMLEFIVTDGPSDITVHYRGMLPNLFREGQGVVAEGHFDGQHFTASRLLAKHDERYMPKEVVETLKKTGHWQPESDAR